MFLQITDISNFTFFLYYIFNVIFVTKACLWLGLGKFMIWIWIKIPGLVATNMDWNNSTEPKGGFSS